jgi:hypothetical protein
MVSFRKNKSIYEIATNAQEAGIAAYVIGEKQ